MSLVKEILIVLLSQPDHPAIESKELAEFVSICALSFHRQPEMRALINQVMQKTLLLRSKVAMVICDFMDDPIDKEHPVEARKLLFYLSKLDLEKFEFKYS